MLKGRIEDTDRSNEEELELSVLSVCKVGNWVLFVVLFVARSADVK